MTTVPLRRYGRWAATLLLVVLGAMGIHTLLSKVAPVDNPNASRWRFDWPTVFHYLFTKTILLGVVVTMSITIIVMVIAFVLAIVLASMRLSGAIQLRGVSWLFIWFFRGTPIWVQLIFWYNVSWLYPSVSFGVPFWHSYATVSTNTALSNLLVVAVLALSLNEAAYLAEIVRGGIIVVDRGQTEAAQALGMSKPSTFRRIVLPQAMRAIIPATGNETISMLKTTSLLATALGGIAIFGIHSGDLFYAANQIAIGNYEIIPLLIVASIWYLVLTSVMTIGQHFIEAHYGKGIATEPTASRWRGSLFGGGRQ